MTRHQHHGLRRARAEHARAARGRRQPRRARGADGRRPLGYVMPIGGVAAYREQVSVVGVGFDIACGNAAIRTDLRLHGTPRARRSPAASSPTRSRTSISFGIGRKNRSDDAPVDHALFESPSWDAVPRNARDGSARQGARAARHGRQRQSLRRRLRRRSGRDLGRRALRQPRLRPHRRVRLPRAVAGREVGRARARARGAAAARSADGPGLLGAHDAGRRVRVRRPRVGGAQGRVASSAGASWSSCTTITTSPGARSTTARPLVVVRKGATPAFPGQKGFVGGSMGDDAVIVRGATAPTSTTDRRAAARRAVLDRARRRPRDVAHAAAGKAQPADRQGAAARARCRRR